MIPSTHSTGPTTALRAWLNDELDARGWSHARLAREIDMSKSSVGRWLMDDDNPLQRRPSYEACRRLARLFGVDLRAVLEMAGIDDYERERHLSDLQRDIMAMVPLIDDRLLAVVQPQFRALIDETVQELVLAQLEGGDGGRPVPRNDRLDPDERPEADAASGARSRQAVGA